MPFSVGKAEEGVVVVAMFNADMLGYRLPGTQFTAGMKDRPVWNLAFGGTWRSPSSTHTLYLAPTAKVKEDFAGF